MSVGQSSVEAMSPVPTSVPTSVPTCVPTSVLLAAVAGFGMGLSLIVAIGAQNAFVLRQGIRRERVTLVVAICAASDVVLIAAGVGGMRAVVAEHHRAVVVAGLLGGAFLVGYAVLAARRSLYPGARALVVQPTTAGPGTTGTTTHTTGRRVALTCLALTWLNPHVYLDTVLLLGTVAAGRGRLGWAFAGLVS